MIKIIFIISIIINILNPATVIAKDLISTELLAPYSIFCYKKVIKLSYKNEPASEKKSNSKAGIAKYMAIQVRNSNSDIAKLDIAKNTFKFIEENDPKSLFPYLAYLLDNSNPEIYNLVPSFIEKYFDLIPLDLHIDLCIYLTTTNHQTSKTENILPILKLYFSKNIISWQAYFFTLRTWVMDLEKWSALNIFSKKIEDNTVFQEFEKINSLNNKKADNSKVVHLKAPKPSENSLDIYVNTTFDNPKFFKRWLDIELPSNEITSNYFKNLLEVFLLLPQYQIISHDLFYDDSTKDNFDQKWYNTKASMTSIGKLFNAFKQNKLFISITTPLGKTKQLTISDMLTTFKEGTQISFKLSPKALLNIMKNGSYSPAITTAA